MPKKDLRGGILNSMKAEEKATEDRFERAETLFAKAQPRATPEPAKVETEETMVLQTFSVRPSDLAKLDQLKMRCLQAAVASDRPEAVKSAMATNRSEVIRIAIEALSRLGDEELLDLVTTSRSTAPRRRRKSS